MKVSSRKKQAPPQQQSQRREEAEEQGSPVAAEAMDAAAAAAQEEEEEADGCSGKAPEAEAEGRMVVVGVQEPADAESRALLTWVLVNVAAPLDRVIAIHVMPASAVEAAAAVDLDAALCFCNLKQVAAVYSESLFRLGRGRARSRAPAAAGAELARPRTRRLRRSSPAPAAAGAELARAFSRARAGCPGPAAARPCSPAPAVRVPRQRGSARPCPRQRRLSGAELARARLRRPGRTSSRHLHARCIRSTARTGCGSSTHAASWLSPPPLRTRPPPCTLGPSTSLSGLMPLLQLPAISFFLTAAAWEVRLHLARARG